MQYQQKYSSVTLESCSLQILANGSWCFKSTLVRNTCGVLETLQTFANVCRFLVCMIWQWQGGVGYEIGGLWLVLPHTICIGVCGPIDPASPNSESNYWHTVSLSACLSGCRLVSFWLSGCLSFNLPIPVSANTKLCVFFLYFQERYCPCTCVFGQFSSVPYIWKKSILGKFSTWHV